MITIYHNPRCSKSRETLSLVQDYASRNQLDTEVVDYQKTPLTLEQLSALLRLLGCKACDMIRSNEDEYTQLRLDQADEETILHAIAAHPKLLQRPIVVQGERAAICRPPELVLNVLHTP